MGPSEIWQASDSQRMSDGISEYTPERMPDKMSEYMSDRCGSLEESTVFFNPLGQLARLVAQRLMQWEVEPEKILNLSQGIQDLL